MSRPIKYEKEEILKHALKLSHEVGYQAVRRDALAEASGTSTGTISRYFGTMTQLKRSIMGAAIAHRDLVVIAQGLAAGDSRAKAAPIELKRKSVGGLL
jgi:AcrR family transcriptional regulator